MSAMSSAMPLFAVGANVLPLPLLFLLLQPLTLVTTWTLVHALPSLRLVRMQGAACLPWRPLSLFAKRVACSSWLTGCLVLHCGWEVT
jgi:hypothetical protein